ncbi:hypothetical protein LWC35_09050 [Pseudonocardia kujensis]|uniref:DUF6925 family protein n=1 Tax=Pseudonocardia kujensis TaxID=1128675 RepID=UPI001E62F2FA|nr:hypothetical protein [Pseudonocardia kujensis]MCE0763058.1 hypothetical protein [Pseudonocardia kujensis]
MVDARGLARELLGDPATGWSMGPPGAIAEFARDPDETSDGDADTVVTGRGGIRLDPPPSAVLAAYETPARPGLRWTQAVAFCLPEDEAHCAGRTTVTELGPDADALRAADRGAVLVDLGLGTPTVDACVRTADPELLALVGTHAGRSLFDTALARELVARSPHRVFLTAVGRVEVYSPIPGPDERSPLGPHTHLLPHLIGRGPGPTVPLPAGHEAVAHAYPAHPAADHLGRPHPFAADRLAAFDALLDAVGDPLLRALKESVRDAVRAGRAPAELPHDPLGRAVVAVTLRQLARTDGPTPADWRPYRDLPAELLDPAGDPNAG